MRGRTAYQIRRFHHPTLYGGAHPTLQTPTTFKYFRASMSDLRPSHGEGALGEKSALHVAATTSASSPTCERSPAHDSFSRTRSSGSDIRPWLLNLASNYDPTLAVMRYGAGGISSQVRTSLKKHCPESDQDCRYSLPSAYLHLVTSDVPVLYIFRVDPSTLCFDPVRQSPTGALYYSHL
ncbi:hypothetical protein P153DRAFT_192031 [Dothidotthia symphoricarpi CBS 119687]|uniref:Uncharacterized protein n=1 Tax=Dothidotthia symphoricarpi CBS 119687 TaxID=1392245 RepID=A0A6A6AH76_9PLEO|nr:uncharacterized protein P153DRAFT_192031 [Dothidotthia symphoricarpi CBS 119687]KAF2131299.1 hypothetical protein P153DRAFT_192031 [Dothidotthia symphoricarpi CBS 119687]